MRYRYLTCTTPECHWAMTFDDDYRGPAAARRKAVIIVLVIIP
jgi:hypothetical protein